MYRQPAARGHVGMSDQGKPEDNLLLHLVCEDLPFDTEKVPGRAVSLPEIDSFKVF